MKPLTILIIEDDESMRDTIKAILKREYEIIEAESGEEALEKLKDNEVQIALIDIKLPCIKGTEILKVIKKERHDIECIMMSAINDAETAAECFKIGAIDYFTKEFDYDIFRHRIKNAAELYRKKRQLKHLQRKIPILESEVEKLRKSNPSLTHPFLLPRKEGIDGRHIFSPDVNNYILTEREVEILRLKGGGLKNKEIADKLSISPLTVKNHINSILHRLNTHSISHAIALAYENGILKILN